MWQMGREVNGYVLAQRLGGGGVGDVFLVHHTSSPNKEWVLKSLRSDLPFADRRVFSQRLMREAEMLANNRHRNIVDVVRGDVDEEGEPYLVMERLRGECLEARLQRVRRLSQKEVIDLGLAMLEALAHLHGRGVVHRDITCSNIMLALDEEGCEVPKLIDFGFAWRDGDEGRTLTVTGQVLGTPRFMAPEQARGERVDARADLYSLGVVLYRALSGVWPYDDHPDGEWPAAQRTGLPVVPIAARKVVAGATLASVIQKALEGDRARRFASASEMARALRRATETDADFSAADVENATLPFQLDRYRLERPIGAGGMGKVYEAYTQLGKRVAVKIFSASASDGQMLEVRFGREGTIAAQFEHENIVSVWESGKVGAVQFLVMEFLQGENLHKRLERDGPLSLRETADVMLPICAAVDHMHQRVALHRDLKPSNIMLERRPGGFTPKLIDFGLAKAQMPLLREETDVDTRPDDWLGTPRYTAPEVYGRLREASPASDVYALGVVIHECLTKRPPNDPGQKGRATSWAQRGVDMPTELVRVVDLCLAYDASTRPTAAELADCLAPYADESVRRQWRTPPTPSTPTSPPERTETAPDDAGHGRASAVPVDEIALAEPSVVPLADRGETTASKTFAVEIVPAHDPIGGAASRPRRSWRWWSSGGILALAAGLLLGSRSCWGVTTDDGTGSLSETQGALEPAATEADDAGGVVPHDVTPRRESRIATESTSPPPTDGSVLPSPTSPTESAVPTPTPRVVLPRIPARPPAAPSTPRSAVTRPPQTSPPSAPTPGRDAGASVAPTPPATAPTATPQPTAARAAAAEPESQPAAQSIPPLGGPAWRTRGSARPASDGSPGGVP